MYTVSALCSGHRYWKDKAWWNSHHLRSSAHHFRSFAHLFKSCGNNLSLYVICTLFQATYIEKTRHDKTFTISGHLHTFSGHLHTFSGHVDIILSLYVICTLFQATDIEKTRHDETATISGLMHTFSGHLHTFSGHVEIIYLFMSYLHCFRPQILKRQGMIKQPPSQVLCTPFQVICTPFQVMWI